MTQSCPGLIAARPPSIERARLRLAALERDQVRINYIGHSTFLIESPQLVRIATDYNDYVRPPVLPDIVTMNHAHSTHYTDRRPIPASSMCCAAGPTTRSRRASICNTRMCACATCRPTSAPSTAARNGTAIRSSSSRSANLCIAHLGHLHHTLTQQQLNEIGRVDVVLVPVDGSYTLDLDGMIEVLHSLKAPLMIPMHYFSAYTLDRFLQRVRQEWDVEIAEVPSLVVSKAALPAKPKVLVLPGH